MKLCGVIAEFNPLTNGHEYLINAAKQKTGLDVLVIMSGNITQRGELAMLNKYDRAECAIRSGASIVFELPTIYALSAAQNFASGAVKLLSRLCVTSLAFGVETANTAALMSLARLKANEPRELKAALKKRMKEGESYSVALYNALVELFPEKKADTKEVFSGSNNILALEYLTAIYKQKLDIEPIFIRRTDNGYLASEPKKLDKTTFLGASAVRNLAKDGKIKEVESFVPAHTLEKLKKINADPRERLDAILLSHLVAASGELSSLYDFDQSLAAVIAKNAKVKPVMSDIIASSVSKCHRENRLSRLAFYPYLGLNKELYRLIDSGLDSINVLAVSSMFKKKLSLLIKEAKLKLVVSNKDKLSLLEAGRENLRLNQLGSNLFSIANKTEIKEDKTIFI